jgi:hypothetical protein
MVETEKLTSSGSKGSLPIGVLSRNLPNVAEEKHDKPVRKARAPAKIRTEHLRNEMLERYRYANLQMKPVMGLKLQAVVVVG